MKAPTLDEAVAELKALELVNPDVKTVDVELQHYMGLLFEFIDLVRNVRAPLRKTRKK